MRIAIPLVSLLIALLVSIPSGAAEPDPNEAKAIAAALQELAKKLADDPQRDELRQALGRSLRSEIAAANQKSSAEWAKIATQEDWERFRKEKLAALRASLGTLPSRPARPKLLVTGELVGEGFKIQNLVYESRPGLVVTANLYLPEPPRDSMPGILLSHSHHNPKHEGELQDMGMTWARAGCYVLVPDHLGHGERRQHPFATAADFKEEFPVSRQDYNFRYDTSLQLYLVGESLMGWLVHDLMTGVDVLLSQPDIDPKRIALLGAVAGGGDPAAVTAALDERIKCLVPFNFGGPQPENRYPLPADAETSFNYAGGGSWESTRNLYRSAADGFLPWVIVGSVAPRYLIHAHEFTWDRERDPVWKRYEKIWGLYDAGDKLAFTQGFGTIQNTQAPASHCNNIGPPHRKLIHEAFQKWFAIDVKPEGEYKNRKSREELTCLTDEARRQFQPQPLHAILAAQAKSAIDVLRQQPHAQRRQQMIEGWTATAPPASVSVRTTGLTDVGTSVIQWREAKISRDESNRDSSFTRAVYLIRKQDGEKVRPLVVGIGSRGASGFLEHRSDELVTLLTSGAAVALVDAFDAGDTDWGQQSSATAHSATQLMLRPPLLSRQLRELTSLMNSFRTQNFVDNDRIILWGESFVDPLPADASFNFPRRVERPEECDPLGPLLALVWALQDQRVAGVYTRGGLVSYASVLESPFVQIPHAAVVPGVLQHGDLPNLVAALAPKPIVLESPVDGRNRRVPSAEAIKQYEGALTAYDNQHVTGKLAIRDRSPDPKAILEVLAWQNQSK